MLVSSADLSFTKAALENTQTMELADSKNTIHIANWMHEVDHAPKKLGDIGFFKEQGVKRLASYIYTDNYGEQIEYKIWEDIVNNLAEFSIHLGGVMNADAIGHFESAAITNNYLQPGQNYLHSFLADGKFYSTGTSYTQTGERQLLEIAALNKDFLTMGDVKDFAYLERIGNSEMNPFEFKMEIPFDYQIERGFQLSKDAFGTVQGDAEFFEFLATKKFKFTAPLIDFGGSKVQNIRNIDGHQTYWNGTGQADYRGITSNTDPININGQTALIAGGVRVRQNEASFYVGVHPSLGALRVVDYNGYNNGVFNYRPATASAWQIASSIEYKENVEEFNESGIDIVKKNKIFKYDYKERDDKGKEKKKEKSKDPKMKKIGIIAEDAGEMQGEDGLTVDLYKMVSISWKALQEILERLETLEQKEKGKK